MKRILFPTLITLSMLGLVFPAVNFNIIPNNVEFASVMGIFEEEHEGEEFEPEDRDELFSKIAQFSLNNFNYSEKIYSFLIHYKCKYTPKVHLPPPDLSLHS